MPDTGRFPPELAGRRDQILGRVLADGRRRRRRRSALRISAVVVPVALSASLLSVALSHSGRSRVTVTGPSQPQTCAAGGVPTAADARTGFEITWGWIPSGWKVVSDESHQFAISPSGSLINGQPSVVAEYRVTGESLAELFTVTGARPAGSYPIVSVDGHSAQVFLPSQGDEQLDKTVTWEPAAGAVITLDDDAGIPEAELLHIARTMSFTPGVADAPVGDLGSVIPRSQAISAAEQGLTVDGPDAGLLARITPETWLATRSEYQAAHIFAEVDGPPDQTDALNSALIAEDDSSSPVWVVALYLDATHWQLAAVDADSGEVFADTSTGLHGLAMPSAVTSLVDHSIAAPCPISSPHPAAVVASAHLPVECSIGQLSARYEGTRTVAGHSQLIIALRNTAGTACALQGAPYQPTMSSDHGYGIGVSGAPTAPPGTDWTDPIVTLAPNAASLPAGQTNPDRLPQGTAWIGLTDQASTVDASRCPTTPLTGIGLSLPYDATMPDIANEIAQADVTALPASVDDCGDGFSAGAYQAP